MTNYKFEARLENVELTKSQVNEINTAIGQIVGKVAIGTIGKGGVFGSKLQINPEWLGIWLRKFATQEALKKAINYKAARI